MTRSITHAAGHRSRRHDALRRWRPPQLPQLDRALALAAWFGIIAGAVLELLLTGFSDQPDRNSMSLICVLVFTLLLVRLAVTFRVKRRERRSIAALAIGVVMWSAESTLLLTSSTGSTHDQLASGEWAFLLTYLVFFAFLVLDADCGPRRAAAIWLETVIVCAGSATLAGSILLTPLANGRPEGVSLLVAVYYPVADVVLALLVLAQVGLRMRAADRKSLDLGLGFMLLAVADTTFAGQVLHGSTQSTLTTQILWGAGFIQLVSGVSRRGTARALGHTRDVPGYVMVGATACAIGVLVFRPDGALGTCLAALAVVTLTAAAARMWLAVREAHRSAEQLALARTDPLTSLPNRGGLLERLEEHLSANEPLALMTLGLASFTEINNALGPATGDTVLQMCGRRLRDAVPAATMVARLGADEFAVLVRDDDRARLLSLADRGIRAIQEPMLAGDIELVVNASAGVAIFDGQQDSSALLREANEAKTEAERTGVAALVYVAAHNHFSAERLRTVDELRRGIQGDQLTLWYQPKVDAATQSITGVEALVRWVHPKHGIVAPIAFLPAARQAGLMPAVSEAVIRRAARDIQRWRVEGLDLRVSLNCPPPELLSGVFVRQLVSVMEEFELSPDDFMIEVTEDSFINDPERARDIVADLRAVGLRVSIDDYGVGFSSLAYLRQLQVDELKVDRSFIAHMTADERSRKIVESTVAMAHALGLEVVAEGVEDSETAGMLIALGADVLQGYHFARPMPAPQVMQWTTEWRHNLATMRTDALPTLAHLVPPQPSVD